MRKLAPPCLLLLCCFSVTACGESTSSDEDASGGPSGGSCTDPGEANCDFEPCGGDIVGSWKLITFCAPSCVSSVYDVVSFDADGNYNGGQGTWEQTGPDGFTITVGAGTASYSYCVSGSIMWTVHGTNCGADSGPVTIVRQRGDCEGEPGTGGRRN